MTKPEILNEVPISMVDLKEELEKNKKRDTELNFRATRTEEHLQQFVKISKKDAEELKKELEALQISRIKEIHMIKIIDLLPDNEEELKQILTGYSLTVKSDDLKKICEVCKKYKKTKK